MAVIATVIMAVVVPVVVAVAVLVLMLVLVCLIVLMRMFVCFRMLMITTRLVTERSLVWGCARHGGFPCLFLLTAHLRP